MKENLTMKPKKKVHRKKPDCICGHPEKAHGDLNIWKGCYIKKGWMGCLCESYRPRKRKP